MSFEGWIALLALIFGPFGGFFLTKAANKHSRKVTTKQVEVAEKQAETSERVADTGEFGSLITGFTASISNLEADLKREVLRTTEVKKDLDIALNKIAEQDATIRHLISRVENMGEDNQELLRHLVVVESMVPDPPGVPPRPQIRTRL